MNVITSRLGLAALCAADGAALVALVPDPSRVRTVLVHPHEAVLRTGADAALGDLADAAVWCAALWLGLGLAAMLAGAVPGAVGAVGRRLGRVLLPRLLRRAVAGAIGLGVLAAPVAAGAAVRTDGPVPPRPPAPAAPAWPTDAAATRAPAPATPSTPSPPTTSAGSVPAPVWPRTAPAAPPTTRPTPHPAGIPRAGSPEARDPKAGTPEAGTPKTRTAPTGALETVRPGDSLWVIAARRLGPGTTDRAIAAAWPRWYAANRAVIGADPDLVVPGQALRPPNQTPSPIRKATQEPS